MDIITNLYHYTSIEALYAIIQGINNGNVCLRGTHISFFNDLTDGVLSANALFACGVPRNVITALMSCSGFPYVVSLSEKEDDLNMWRCYATEGKGVAIELKKSVLDNTFGDELQKCKYISPKEVECLIKSTFGVEIYNDAKDTLPLSRFLHSSCIYKHNSFRDENEWRIIKHDVTEKFRLGPTGIVPYLDFNIPIDAISSIRLGPKCDFPRNSFSITELLKTKGLRQIKVDHSSIPLQ